MCNSASHCAALDQQWLLHPEHHAYLEINIKSLPVVNAIDLNCTNELLC